MIPGLRVQSFQEGILQRCAGGVEGSLGMRIWDTPKAEGVGGIPGLRCVMGVQGDPPGWRYTENS